jgi:hypothetical protein
MNDGVLVDATISEFVPWKFEGRSDFYKHTDNQLLS